MGEPFIGEIKVFPFVFAPRLWSQCNGQLLPIAQNQALFSLLGTTYGGNGQTTFALPDLRGRVPLHLGGNFSLGQRAGTESHTLTQLEMPQHIHTASVFDGAGDTPAPTGNLLADVPAKQYNTPDNLTALLPAVVVSAGGSQAHENRQPLLTLNFCIALQGLFPSQS